MIGLHCLGGPGFSSRSVKRQFSSALDSETQWTKCATNRCKLSKRLILEIDDNLSHRLVIDYKYIYISIN